MVGKANNSSPEMEKVLKSIEAEANEKQKLESFRTGGAEWDRAWNTTAENYAKFGAVIWVIYGIYAVFFAHKLDDGISLIALFFLLPLYFLLGPALAAVSAIVPCLPMFLLNTLCYKYRNSLVLSISATIVTLLTWILVTVWTIFLANWIIGVINGFF